MSLKAYFFFIHIIVVFMCGWPFYKAERKNRGNILCQVVGCIWFAALNKIKGNPKQVKRWIDGSTGRYSEFFIDGVHAYLKVSIYYFYQNILTERGHF